MRIKEYKEYSISKNGVITSYKRRKNGKILKQNEDKDGYLKVSLYKNSKPKRFFVHRLVLLNFKPHPMSDELQVNHVDGNKKNNNLKNLEWVTGKENINHAIKINLKKGIKGENNFNSKLTEKDVKLILKMRKKYKMTQSEISKYFKVGRTTIRDIVNKKTWKHITNFNEGGI